MSELKQVKLLQSSCQAVSGGEPLEHAMNHLVAAGVGRILVLGDEQHLSSFRQMRYSNPDVKVDMHELNSHAEPKEDLFSGVGVVMESSLDWQFKLRLSDLCMRLHIPLIHSGSSNLRFQLFAMVPGKSACLRCVLPIIGMEDVPLKPVARDTFAPVAACVGSLMALEAIKLLSGLGATQGNELWRVDGLSGEIEIVRGLDPRRDCPDCGRYR